MGSRLEFYGGEVRVSVSQQENGLKKQERRVPYGGGSPERGQDNLRRHRLNHEQQARAEESGKNEQKTHVRGIVAFLKPVFGDLSFGFKRLALHAEERAMKIIDYQTGKELTDVSITLSEDELKDLAAYVLKLGHDCHVPRAHLTEYAGCNPRSELTLAIESRVRP